MHSATSNGHAVNVPDSFDDIQATLDTLAPEEVIDMNSSQSCLGQYVLAHVNPEATYVDFVYTHGYVGFGMPGDPGCGTHYPVELTGDAYAFFDAIFRAEPVRLLDQLAGQQPCMCGDPACTIPGYTVSVAALRQALDAFRASRAQAEIATI